MLSRYLTDDHTRLDALLARAVADPACFDVEAFEQFRTGLLRHIGIEEKILFPEAKRLAGERPLPGLDRVRMEHAALASLLVPTPDRALALEIAALLRIHNAREEGKGALYQLCESLPGFDGEALTRRARAAAPPPLAAHFDGEGAMRTAAEALSSAERSFARRREREHGPTAT